MQIYTLANPAVLSGFYTAASGKAEHLQCLPYEGVICYDLYMKPPYTNSDHWSSQSLGNSE